MKIGAGGMPLWGCLLRFVFVVQVYFGIYKYKKNPRQR